MELLSNPIRHYAWGSRSAIAATQGRPVPSAEPEAELWIGGHPADPSRLVRDGRRLDAVVAADPAGELGPAARFGRLPFLLKLLAADSPLSLQAHPDEDQARAGFAADEADGLAVSDPKRSYVDPHHKPELLCAVTEFHALCGFRPVAESLAAFDGLGLGVPALTPLLDAFSATGGLDAFFAGLLGLPDGVRQQVAADVVAACGHADSSPDYALVADLGRRYPGDIGAVVALLLNHVVLAPGEAIFVGAGVLHGYLRGVGVEVMAGSDNVLRGGLTPKHMDVPELLRVVRFVPGPVSPLLPSEPSPGVRVWQPPVDEFSLTRVELTAAGGSVTLSADGPRVLFCLVGTVTVDDGTGPVTIPPGGAGYLSAGRDPAVITGDGTVFQATTA